MSAPSPLVPEGALPSKGKSNVRIAIFTILAIHVVLLGGLLIQGCKPSNKDTAKNTESDSLPPLAPSSDVAVTPVSSTPVEPTAAVAPAPSSASGVTPEVVTTTPAVIPANPVVVSAPVAPAIPSSTAVMPIPAIPASSDTSVASGDMKVHTVAKGEMLSTIARKYKISLKALTDANPSVNPMKLQVGQKLNVPASVASAPKTESVASLATSTSASVSGNVYVVKTGDALEKIARNNKTTVKAIKELNNMRTDRIKVGDKLKIPSTSSAEVEKAPAAPYTVPTEVASAPSPTVVR